MREVWLEIRSSFELPASFGGQVEPPDDEAPKDEVFFSLVAGTSGTSAARKLPVLYLGNAAVHVGRTEDEIVQEAQRLLQRLGPSRPTYWLQACRFGEAWGLYSRDHLARSAYRRRIEREGCRFEGDQLVAYRGEGSFETLDGHAFRPRFLITDNPPGSEGIEKHTPAVTAFTLASYRLGGVSHPELLELLDLSASLHSVGGPLPADVAQEVRGSL